jgi:putative transcription antitermination factor YqgF
VAVAFRIAAVRILALDYGRARTGVAISDPTGIVARPVGVVRRAGGSDGLAELARLVDENGVDRVVVGMPLTLRGDRGEQARETESFVEVLAARIDVPVVTFDERFTTDLAERSAARGDEDARAAAHLLSSYLEWTSNARA